MERITPTGKRGDKHTICQLTSLCMLQITCLVLSPVTATFMVRLCSASGATAGVTEHLCYPASCIINDRSRQTDQTNIHHHSSIHHSLTMEDLPNEILCKIFSALSCKDLLSASLVSHHILRIVQPILYKKPTVLPDYNYRDPLPLFLRTILLAPCRESLAGHVRSLKVAIGHLGETTPPDDAERGTKIVQLLGLLPRLTSLTLGADYARCGTGYEQLEAALQHPTNLPAALLTIRKFKSEGTNMFTGVKTSLLVSLMCLPSIRNIFVSITDFFADGQITDKEMDECAASAAPCASTSPITELTLRYGDILPKSMATILMLPKALIRFNYETKMADFDLRGIGRALLPLQHSLQHLYLQFHETEGPYFEPTMRDTIWSLRGWTSLRILHIQIVSLLGWKTDGVLCLADVLPLGLQVLVVEHDDCWQAGKAVQQVTGALEQGMLTALREVWVYSFDHTRTSEVEESFQNACIRAGVKCAVRAKLD